MRIFPDAPRIRNGDGFLPHQLALEHGHRALAEALAGRAGKLMPKKPVRSLLNTSTSTLNTTPAGGEVNDAVEAALSTGDAPTVPRPASPVIRAEPAPVEGVGG